MITVEVIKSPGKKRAKQIPGRLIDTAWMLKRIRRRIEDHLRKEATAEEILAVAEFLKIKKGFGLE